MIINVNIRKKAQGSLSLFKGKRERNTVAVPPFYLVPGCGAGRTSKIEVFNWSFDTVLINGEN